MPRLFICKDKEGKFRCLTDVQAKEIGAEILATVFPLF